MPLSVASRPLTGEELARLRAKRPPFILWKSRRLANQEIARAVGEQLDFEVQRAWNASPCEPPCCPPSLLFQVSAEEFVWVNIYDLEEDVPLAGIPRRRFRIVRSPLLKVIVSWSASGEPVRLEPTQIAESGERGRWALIQKPPISIHNECLVFRLSDFSVEVQKRLRTGGGDGGDHEQGK
jgi:hypothetical protein